MKSFKNIPSLASICIISVMIFNQSCVKDELDFSKVSKMVLLNPDIAAPVAWGSLTIEDLFKDAFEDSTLLRRDDTIYVLIREDSIFNYNVKDFVDIPDQYNAYTYNITATEDIVSPGFYHLPLDFLKDSIEISLGNNMRIDSLFTNSGYLQLDIFSDFTITGALRVRVPSLYIDSRPFDSLFTFSRPSGDYQRTHLIPLENAKIIVDNSNPAFSKLKIELSVVVDLQPGDMIHTGDRADLDISFHDIEDFEAMFGYAGDTTFTSDTLIDTELDDVINNITGTFAITNPKININYTHSVGLPVGFDLKIIGNFKDASDVTLEPPSQQIVYSSDYLNPEVTDKFTFNRENISNIDQFLVFPPPVQVGYEATVRANPSGNTSTLNYLLGNSNILMGMEVEIPLEFRADLTLRDTFELDLGDIDKDQIDYVVFARLLYKMKNEFPISFNASLVLYDSINNINLDTLKLNDLNEDLFLEAAPVDNEGESILDNVEEVTGTMTLNKEQIHDLFFNAQKLIMIAKISSYDPANVPSVKILDYYKFDFRFRIEGEIYYKGKLE